MSQGSASLSDFLAYYDADAGAMRKDSIQDILALVSSADIDFSSLTAVTPVVSDSVLLFDASDSNNKKSATLQNILGLVDDFKVIDASTATPTTSDYLVFADDSATGDPNRKATISTILALGSQSAFDINALTAETSANDADTLAIYDTSASAMRKMTRANFLSGVSSLVSAETAGTPVATDYLVFSDESETGDPNRKATISTILALAADTTFDISALPSESTVADADFVAIYDASASAMKAMTRANFLSGFRGAFTSAFETKLTGIETGAQVNAKHEIKFACISADTGETIGDSQIGFYTSTNQQVQSGDIKQTTRIDVPDAAALFGQNPSQPQTPLGTVPTTRLFGDVLANGGQIKLALNKQGTTDYVYVQAETVTVKAGGWSLTNLSWVGSVTIAGTNDTWNIVAAGSSGFRLTKDIPDLISKYVQKTDLEGHETDTFRSYDNALFGADYFVGNWCLFTGTTDRTYGRYACHSSA